MNPTILETSELKLAKPGAGLPWPESKIAGLIFRWHVFGSTRETAEALIETQRREILGLVSRVPEASAARPILIKRLPGLEDSSRYWSIYMTLEHLRIVNQAVASTISSLGRGEVPARRASTADVKPGMGIGPDVVDSFSESCEEIKQAVAGVENLKTSAQFPHPWFGPLDASEWHAMAGFHMRLHQRQIQKILSQLKMR